MQRLKRQANAKHLASRLSSRHMAVTAPTAQRHLTHFIKLDLLRLIGKRPATEYHVLQA